MGLAHKNLCDNYPTALIISEEDILLFSAQIDPL